MGKLKLLKLLFNLILSFSFTKAIPAFSVLNEYDGGALNLVNIQQAENIFIGNFEDTIGFESKAPKNYDLSAYRIFTFGHRADDDEKLGFGHLENSWNNKRDAVLNVVFPPEHRKFKCITKMEITVDTDGDVQKPEIKSGGIKQGYIFVQTIIKAAKYVKADYKVFGFM